MVTGIKASLHEKITKHSEVLGKDVQFDKTSNVIAFPEYLIVNFIRFFWKAKEQVKAKILKKVTFPLSFDASLLSDNSADDHKNPVEYELISVITHIGRSADSGHYISWSKRNGTDKDLERKRMVCLIITCLSLDRYLVEI
jgi:ubiquitin carboxyl-terminal hydrolase 14